MDSSYCEVDQLYMHVNMHYNIGSLNPNHIKPNKEQRTYNMRKFVVGNQNKKTESSTHLKERVGVQVSVPKTKKKNKRSPP